MSGAESLHTGRGEEEEEEETPNQGIVRVEIQTD